MNSTLLETVEPLKKRIFRDTNLLEGGHESVPWLCIVFNLRIFNLHHSQRHETISFLIKFSLKVMKLLASTNFYKVRKRGKPQKMEGKFGQQRLLWYLTKCTCNTVNVHFLQSAILYYNIYFEYVTRDWCTIITKRK